MSTDENKKKTKYINVDDDVGDDNNNKEKTKKANSKTNPRRARDRER